MINTLELEREFSDDRFEHVEFASEAVDVAETVVRELAVEHAPDDVCGACSQQPLAMNSASDVAQANAVESVVADATAIAEHFGEETWWIHETVTRAYMRAYREACADPGDCWVCADAQIDDDMECGHTRHGEPCPVAES